MTRKTGIAVIAVSFVLTAISCVREVTLDAMEEPTVVVECILRDEPVQTLYLTYTKGASREEAQDLPEAKAVLTDLTEGKEAGRFSRAADGSWTLDYAAVPEHRYRLDVELPGHEPIWAEQTMPDALGVSVRWQHWNPDPADSDVEINMPLDWYGGRYGLLPGPYSRNIGYSFRFQGNRNPVWFCGVNYPDQSSSGEPTRYLCTDSPYADPFNIAWDQLYFDPYYEVQDNHTRYLWGGFGSSGFQVSCYPGLEQQPLHKGFLRFPARDNPPEEEFMVSGSFQGYISDYKNFVHAQVRPAELHYFSASEDYDRFLMDFSNLEELKLSSNLSDIFVRENIYSNIQGAIGLFGAKIEKSLEWEGRDVWMANGYFLLASFVSRMPMKVLEDDEHGLDHGESNGIEFGRLNLDTEQRPFELFHFEFWYGTPLPDWAPDWDYSFHSVVVIQNEQELAAHGLGQYGPVDFSQKKALLCSMQLPAYVFPFLVGYGRPMNPAYNPENLYMPLMGIAYFQFDKESPRKGNNAFRFVILVDKNDNVASEIHPGTGVFGFTFGYISSSFAEGLGVNTP